MKRGLKRGQVCRCENGSGLPLTLVCHILFLMISVVHFDEPAPSLSHNVFDIY